MNRAKVLAPVRTGRLRGSIHALPPAIFTLRPKVKVVADVEYAAAVNNGSRPHKIRARNKPWLKFRVNGQWVQVREVNHPGNKAKPFLDDALRQIAGGRGYRIEDG